MTDNRPAPKPKPPKKHAPDPAQSLKTTFAKGEVWMVSENPENPSTGTEIWSNRPAVIISANMVNDHTGCLSVAYLTTSTIKRASPTHIAVPSPTNSSKEALVLCEQIHAVDASRMRYRMSTVPQRLVYEIDKAVSLTLSLHKDPNYAGLFKKWEQYIKTQQIDWPTEIQALAHQSTDERTQALTSALELITRERDAYRQLYESSAHLPAVMQQIAEAPSLDGLEETIENTMKDQL